MNVESDSLEEREASPRDQITFWALTFSFMLKLVAIGLTIFVLPFNEWIILDKSDSQSKIIVNIYVFFMYI